MKAPTSPFARTRAFTLTELLVAIAVVAILAALAYPALSSVLGRTKQVQCTNNLRQLGVAIQAYVMDNGDRLPISTHSAGVKFTKAWQVKLVPYLGGDLAPNGTVANYGGAEETLVSPGDDQADTRLAAMQGGASLPNSSYLYNDFLEDIRHNRMSKLEHPATTILLFPASDSIGISIANDHIHGTNWDKGWKQLKSDLQPNRFRNGPSDADKTNGSAAYLFADGHVEAIKADDLKARLDAGENPARP